MGKDVSYALHYVKWAETDNFSGKNEVFHVSGVHIMKNVNTIHIPIVCFI